MDFKELHKPFHPSKVSWRVGATTKDKKKGMGLAYIDARNVMERLDEVCGPGNWQDSYSETPKGRVICRLAIRIGDEWVTKSDGAGNTDVEGDKGALSDSLKRAAVKWGIGRYLYDVHSPWVEIDDYKKFKNPNDPAFHNALHHALGGPVGGGEAFERTAETPKRATNNPQTQEEIGEALDWTTKALDLKAQIQKCTQLGYLQKVASGDEFKDFAAKAPDDLVKQVRDAYHAKKDTYNNAGVH